MLTMTKYAVIKLKNSQFKVSEGDEILVDKLSEKPDAEVLMVVEDGKVKLGKPKVKGAKVILKVIEEKEKGKKIHVQKYKAKSRYRRKIGFRPVFTRLKAQKISS